MSAVTMSRLRSTRSTRTPANGPNSTDGSSRANIIPATANDLLAADTPPRRVTRAATATNPTQSPSDDTVIAAISFEKVGWRNSSLRVAGLVPRRTAMSSATLATGGAETTAWRGPRAGIGGPGGSSPEERSDEDQAAAPPWSKRAAEGSPVRSAAGATDQEPAAAGSAFTISPQLVHFVSPPAW